ncbi:pantoate--beta-alanine ligase [Aliiroseovarius sp. F47248L]|uniref:pantoate--beta-alanine ligase n=1 Tax=Aliiroseovarius sp. F47248L TaxID=2926420 RepID=UPI001FF254DE|nr:pantoate--beta-alanine ligase [Aliiroseovarius sp. F47248L]MCK0137619.1 pantoate--beta-alanine ligase [Aliiroseovarius sp. F47248L]
MKLVRTKKDLRTLRRKWIFKGERVAVVPTMGALHAGHLSLVEVAKQNADRVIVTIFVNPKQFNNPGDLENYPRTEEEDAAKLSPYGIDALYVPTPDQIYPKGFATNVRVSGLTEELEGAHRPGHFDGVATVVSKLFLQSRADVACFGEKDYQQMLLVRRLSEDLDIETEVLGCPTIREQDGLAMSSRNVRLSSEQRAVAPALKTELDRAARAIRRGADIRVVLDSAKAQIERAGYDKVEYLELRDATDLMPVSNLDRPARLLVAATLGDVRLIDNIPV